METTEVTAAEIPVPVDLETAPSKHDGGSTVLDSKLKEQQPLLQDETSITPRQASEIQDEINQVLEKTSQAEYVAHVAVAEVPEKVIEDPLHNSTFSDTAPIQASQSVKAGDNYSLTQNENQLSSKKKIMNQLGPPTQKNVRHSAHRNTHQSLRTDPAFRSLMQQQKLNRQNVHALSGFNLDESKLETEALDLMFQKKSKNLQGLYTH